MLKSAIFSISFALATATLIGAGPALAQSPAISISGVVNAASFAGGSVAPGEVITIFGANLGPAQLTTYQVQNGRFTTSLANVQVLFNEEPGALVYVSAAQVSAIAPLTIASKSTVEVEVVYKGLASNSVTAPVAATSPAVFSVNASGRGPGAILNQNSSVNSAANPAAAGSVIQIFGTGGGAMKPAVADGQLVTGTPLPAIVAPLAVSIGGTAATVQYAGAAPGLVGGLFQIDATIPKTVGAGPQPVLVKIGNATSPAGLTVTVQGAATSAPELTLAPAVVNFGTSPVNQAATANLTMQNTGTAPLTISAIDISGAAFAATAPPALPLTVPPAGTSTVQLTMTPAAIGQQSGAVIIASDSATNPKVTVNLTGYSPAPPAPAMSLSPAALNFGTVAVGQTGTATLTIGNHGQGPLNLSTLSASGAFSVIAPAGPLSVAAGASATVTISFSPIAAGAQIGSLTIASNDPLNPAAVVTLTGTGNVPSSQISVSTSVVNFGNVAQGATATGSVTVSNSGTVPLNVTGLSTGGAFTVVSPTTPLTLAPGGSVTVTLAVTPTSTGAQNSSLSISSSDPSHPAVNVTLVANSPLGPTYTLSSIVVTRNYLSPSLAQVGIAPTTETLGPTAQNIVMGWDYNLPDPTLGPNIAQASAVLNLAALPATVNPGSAASLAATLSGFWNDTGFSGTRNHVISLSGAAGSGNFNAGTNANGAYSGTLSVSNATNAPQPDATGAVTFTLMAQLQYAAGSQPVAGSDAAVTMTVKLVYLVTPVTPAPAVYGSYALASIAVNRTYSTTAVANVGTQAASQTLAATTTSVPFGFNYTATGNAAQVTGSLTFSGLPASISPGAALSLAASLTGNWVTSGFTTARDHTLELVGDLGAASRDFSDSTNGTVSGQISASDSLYAPEPNASKQIIFYVTAVLRFGSDYNTTMTIQFIYQ